MQGLNLIHINKRDPLRFKSYSSQGDEYCDIDILMNFLAYQWRDPNLAELRGS